MKPNSPKVLIPIALLLVLVIYAGNFLTGGATYSANLGDLKSQFNSGKEKCGC